MFPRSTFAPAFAFAMSSLPGGALAHDMATAPETGTYQLELYVQSVSGAGCLDRAGYVFVGSMSFAGLSGAKHYLRALETGSNFAVDSVQTLTVKSGKGTTNLSGDLAWTGAGIGGSWSESGTFSATVTEIGTHTFVMALKESYSGCTSEDINLALVRTGANQ